MLDFETDFNCAENNSLEIVPYQFEPLLKSSSANIITKTSSSEDDLENGGTEEEHISERIGNTDWGVVVFKIEAYLKIQMFTNTVCVRKVLARADFLFSG